MNALNVRTARSWLNRRMLIMKSTTNWESLPQGQRAALLRYPIHHSNSLCTLFDITSLEDKCLEKAKEDLRDTFCTKNNITVSAFKERYDIRASEDLSSVGVFDVLLQENVDKKIDAFQQEITSKIKAQMDNMDESCPTPIMIAQSAPKIDDVLMELKVSKVGLACDHYESHCMTVIPKYLINVIKFASVALSIDQNKFVIIYAMSSSITLRYTPCVMFATIGDFFVEIASWR
jgi:hypothetical protein